MGPEELSDILKATWRISDRVSIKSPAVCTTQIWKAEMLTQPVLWL